MKFKNIFKTRKNYRLPLGYQENLSPTYYTDISSGNLIYQPHIYKLGLYFSDRANISTIVDIGSGNGLKLIPFLEKGYQVYCVDIGENIAILKKNLSDFTNITYIECDLSKSFPAIQEIVLRESLIIAADVVEHIIEVDSFFQWLAQISYQAKYLLISTPDRDRARGYGDLGIPANLTHVREWNANEFKLLLRDYQFNNHLFGHTINTNQHKAKANTLVISGREVAHTKKIKNLKSILAIINVYNEQDVIIETVEHLLNQGVDVYLYDDNSTDGTYEVLQEKYKNSSRVFINKRTEISQDYEWEKLLKHTEKIAQEYDYDWFMHSDADEIRYSPWMDVTIAEAVTFIDMLGYSAIDFTVLDFRFVPKNDSVKSKYEQNILAFEFGKRSGHFSQIKLWKKQDSRVDLHSSGGHEVKFENRKVYPVKFLLKHYPLRNREQMTKKIFQDRNQRLQKEQNEKGWHTQYNAILEKGIDKLPWENKHLLYWNEYIIRDGFMVELISGIGIIE